MLSRRYQLIKLLNKQSFDGAEQFNKDNINANQIQNTNQHKSDERTPQFQNTSITSNPYLNPENQSQKLTHRKNKPKTWEKTHLHDHSMRVDVEKSNIRK